MILPARSLSSCGVAISYSDVAYFVWLCRLKLGGGLRISHINSGCGNRLLLTAAGLWTVLIVSVISYPKVAACCYWHLVSWRSAIQDIDVARIYHRRVDGRYLWDLRA